MFSTAGLFRTIPCPNPQICEALNCIFSHDPELLKSVKKSVVQLASTADVDHDDHEPPIKRRRLENDGRKPFSTSTKHAQESASIPVKSMSQPITSNPRSLARSISPPAPVVKPQNTLKQQIKKPIRKETLNPRMISNPPAGHDKRLLYLKYIYEQMLRLNNLIVTSKNEEEKTLHLNEDELIMASLDEEEHLALTSGAVYGNIIKQRIVLYKKMTMNDWAQHVKTRIIAQTAVAAKPAVKAVDSRLITGLTSVQEVVILKRIVSLKDALEDMGFVMEPPSDASIAEARLLQQQSACHEVCDRCQTRFQVFPERRELDGALTTNGSCTYHWGKLRRPRRAKTDAITGSKEPVYLCCDEISTSIGCTTADTHVYKTVQPARMASVMQFKDTPPNSDPKTDSNGKTIRALTFDCEMGYTVHGLELIRLTALTWPENKLLIDVLVQPKGPVLDFNTRFSGVSADVFRRARKWTIDQAVLPMNIDDDSGQSSLSIVPSPECARDILCSYITPETILIGHAFENDLNVVRLCHQNIVDTVALFPHPAGLPIRHGLKTLAQSHLNRDIQTGGALGHDSLEDAEATGDLVKVKIGKVWTDMLRAGWKFDSQDNLLESMTML